MGLTSRGSNFLSGVVPELLRSEGDSRVLTASYHQQTGDKKENSHELIFSQMRASATENPRDWDRLLRPFDAAYNTAPTEGTQFTPNAIFRCWVSVGVTERMVSPIDSAPPLEI